MNLMSYGIPYNSEETITKKKPNTCHFGFSRNACLWFYKLSFSFFLFPFIFDGLFVPPTMASGPLRLVWMFCISKQYLFICWFIIRFSECPTVTLHKLRNNNRSKMIVRNLNKGFHYCFQNCSVIVLSTPII